MTATLLGAIAPDLDLFYFYTLDACRHHHHSYWTHYPSGWLALMLLAWGVSRIKRWSTGGTWLLIFSMSGFLHLLLDCMVGDISLYWLRGPCAFTHWPPSRRSTIPGG